MWLSNGLEEAFLAYLAQATDKTFALHAAVYEFQKPELLQGLKDAIGRGVEVKVVYHHRKKDAEGHDRREERRRHQEGRPRGSWSSPERRIRRRPIMHNKFVVLLKKSGGTLVPQAVWTGSTNWTDGGIYGQLNVGHAVYDPDVAATYEAYFQLLHADTDTSAMKQARDGTHPRLVASPGRSQGHADLLAAGRPTRCSTSMPGSARMPTCLMVCAPFALSPIILAR